MINHLESLDLWEVVEINYDVPELLEKSNSSSSNGRQKKAKEKNFEFQNLPKRFRIISRKWDVAMKEPKACKLARGFKMYRGYVHYFPITL